MLRTLPEEGLSRQAKALLKLLKWAEEKKGELPKREPKENTIKGWTHDCRRKNNTREGQRANQRAFESATNSKASI